MFLGKYLYDGIGNLCKQFPHLIDSVRSLGTFGAFNAASTKVRDDIVVKLRNLGVQSGGCGERAIRLRPCLTFNEKHAAILLDRLSTVLKSF